MAELKPFMIRLSEGDRMIAMYLSEKYGISMSGVIRMLLRQAAEQKQEGNQHE